MEFVGYGFLWTDLAAYLIGIGYGTIFDKIVKVISESGARGQVSFIRVKEKKYE